MYLLTPRDTFQHTLDLLEELTAISSPSGDVDGLRRCTERLAEALEPTSLTVEIRDEEGAGGAPQPVLHAFSRGTQERCLLAVGHLDTVLPAMSVRRCRRPWYLNVSRS